MITYNRQWLSNLLVQEELQNAYDENCISEEEKAAAKILYPTGFYRPNIFIRAGLFILTLVIAGFSLGLILLIFLSSGNERSLGAILIFFGIVAYGALELMVTKKNHYHSGVDDALLWVCGICIISGINLYAPVFAAVNMLLVAVFALFFLLRFANASMGVIVVVALLGVVFFTYSKAGVTAKATVPFLLLVLAGAINFVANNLLAKEACRMYKKTLTVIRITSLLCAYLAVNYYVVRKAGNAMFNMDLKKGQPLAFGWIFWLFTFVIPCRYIFSGIRKKDIVLIRVGLLLVAATVFTFRFYYAILPLETAMAIVGVILIGVAYGLINYLQQERRGFISTAPADNKLVAKTNMEALIVTQAFGGQHEAAGNTNTGGGSFGGGGASGDF